MRFVRVVALVTFAYCVPAPSKVAAAPRLAMELTPSALGVCRTSELGHVLVVLRNEATTTVRNLCVQAYVNSVEGTTAQGGGFDRPIQAEHERFAELPGWCIASRTPGRSSNFRALRGERCAPAT
jgi:hypothetical protein